MSATESATDADARSITVLEFALGSQRCCMRIERVIEIVSRNEITSLPNTQAHIEGVMDLRGKTTKIIDPTKLLDFAGEGSKDKIVVLEDEGSSPVGWLVDDVYRVNRVNTDTLDDSVGSGAVKGVFAGGEHVIWIEPDDALTAR